MTTFLSGIQPSGLPHLGNYFGAIREHIELSREAGEFYYFIADYHALTTSREPERLREAVREIAVTYLALGLDPERVALFRQSDVPEVCEIAWLLACVTGMGLLERAHSYKDKVARGIKPNVGLFTYPVLMAADILAYDTDQVPVGKDQIQHIEMARDNAVVAPRHIHVVVSHPEHERLISLIFLKGDEHLAGSPYPELAIPLEKSNSPEGEILFGLVELVLRPLGD
jgi:tryptophanyl-tRNA synthetase